VKVTGALPTQAGSVDTAARVLPDGRPVPNLYAGSSVAAGSPATDRAATSLQRPPDGLGCGMLAGRDAARAIREDGIRST
jgi:hypothetical protein